VPVRERMIPKSGGKRRRFGIPTVRDRVVQAALKLVLEPIFEADFAPCSYGFRPEQRAQDAIAKIHYLTSRSYEWVVDADISACFDEIDHRALMGRARQRIADRRVLALVMAFLRSGSPANTSTRVMFAHRATPGPLKCRGFSVSSVSIERASFGDDRERALATSHFRHACRQSADQAGVMSRPSWSSTTRSATSSIAGRESPRLR